MKSRIETYHHHESVDSEKIKLLDDYLVPGTCVDLGCGNGLYGITMLQHCDDLLQIDIQDQRTDQAREFDFQAADIEELSLPENSFDNVVAFDIMEHLDDDRRFLRMIQRACKSKLILSVPNSDDEQPQQIQLTHMHHIDKTHRREYSCDGLQEILEHYGFSVLEMRPHYNWGLFNVGRALAKPGFIPALAARTLKVQAHLYRKLGLFVNRCVPDWFCVAEVRHSNRMS